MTFESDIWIPTLTSIKHQRRQIHAPEINYLLVNRSYENWPSEVNALSLSLARFSMIWPLGWKLWTGYESLVEGVEADDRPKRSESPGGMIVPRGGLTQVMETQ